MLVIIDYGMGNLRNVQKAFEHLGFPAEISQKSLDLRRAKGLVLPGVGAYPQAMKNLKKRGLVKAIENEIKCGKPLLGLCLGMQLLFDESLEWGRHEGLGLISGQVLPFPKRLKSPHMGWNTLKKCNRSPLLKSLPSSPFVYFVHSYYCKPSEKNAVLAKTSYGFPFCSVAAKDSIFGCQFHPEKSQNAGMSILKNFACLCQEANSHEPIGN